MDKKMFIPVLMTEDNYYIKGLNEEIANELNLMHTAQEFPVVGDTICFKAWDPVEITARAFLPIPETPMIYLFTPFWDREKEEESIYGTLMDEKHNGEEFDVEDEDYKKMVNESIWRYHDYDDIYENQKGLLNPKPQEP